MIKSLNDLIKAAGSIEKRKIAIAQAADIEMLEVAEAAIKQNLAEFIFTGDKATIEELIKTGGFDLGDTEIVHCDNEAACAKKAVELVRTKKAHMPMKGLLPTATFMKAVLDKENGLRTGALITQITITDRPDGNGLHFITDCAMNIKPDLSAKKSIIENAVLLAKSFGYERPKVALITALETVNEAMPETVDAAILSKMCDRGQIKGCIVDGPFALDNAISEQSAHHKGIGGVVAGNADILVVSDICMGNVLHKALTYYAKKQIGSVIIGTSAPIVMTSRSDSVSDKVLSIAASCYFTE